ncbi:hypothetical protein FPHYL_9985 [Fusarium phyllophilum]|uniref:Uncharacterized protein n=1 Tax=Fusarium phyllophilum TaxID=47803 RepID=A0A8H5J3R0_9HYPO|nr:hypothetical protein FPHYL_9985 [Fusarium phyllophilum]
MVKLHRTINSSTKEKDAPMPAINVKGRVEPGFRVGLRFRPHDGSLGAQERDFVKLSNAPSKTQLDRHDMPAIYATQHADHLFQSFMAAFSDVEQTMARDLADKLKEAILQTWKHFPTTGPTYKANVIARVPYKKLTGTHGFKKQLHYPDWFIMAVWLGPGHPLLQSIRKDMSDLWGLQFPTDAIVYPKFVHIKTQESLFHGNPATAPEDDGLALEERAKAIKKTIDDSPVNGLSAAIKGHLPGMLSDSLSGTRLYGLEMRLASTNHELEDARKQVNDLEKQLAESKASQARAQEKTSSDMETLRKEIQLLKAARASNTKKDVEALRATVAGMEAKALKGEKKVEEEMNTLRSEVAQSAEKAEKAVETGALVLSVLSNPGGQKRKMDEIS